VIALPAFARGGSGRRQLPSRREPEGVTTGRPSSVAKTASCGGLLLDLHVVLD
jgi:hypothetical protein